MSVASTGAGGWKTKTPKERMAALKTIKAAGKLNCTWKRTAALLDVNECTLNRWRKDDPENKIDTAHEVGKSEAGKEVMNLMMERARDAEAHGSSSVLIHLSKSLCNMGDSSTHKVVTPSDLAPGDGKEDRLERRAVALDMLGLSALDAKPDEPVAEKDDDADPQA